MAAPSLPVSAAALRRADLLFKKGDQASAPREAAYALLCDEGGTFDGGALLKKCLAAVAQNPYGSLGLTTDATDAQIKKAYRKLALKLHPDKNPKTTPLFQAVKTAYDALQDHTGKIKAKRAYESAERERNGRRREYATMRDFERKTRGRAYQYAGNPAWGCGYGARPKPRYQRGPTASERYEEIRRAEARRAELQRARERAAAVERARKLRERQRELQRQRERQRAEARARGHCRRPSAAERQRERDEAIRRGARLAAERERKKREQKEREERERQERLAEEQRKRDEQAKAKRHASMFDDLMAGALAASRRVFTSFKRLVSNTRCRGSFLFLF